MPLSLNSKDQRLFVAALGAPSALAATEPAARATRRRLARQVDDLARMVDVLPAASAAYSADGRLLHANRRLLDLLGTEPRSEELRTALEHAAGTPERLLRDTASGVDPGQAPPPPCTGYRLRATLLDSLLPHPVVLVTAEPVRALPPSTAELARRFGLTHRQAEVALLLAQRLSNREIAERLVISPHTALRHTEAVKAKLDVRDRRLVAERLLEPEDG